jgi:hypothetical protein
MGENYLRACTCLAGAHSPILNDLDRNNLTVIKPAGFAYLLLSESKFCFPKASFAFRKQVLLSESKFCFPKASFAFRKQVLLSQSKFCFPKAIFAFPKQSLLTSEPRLYLTVVARAEPNRDKLALRSEWQEGRWRQWVPEGAEHYQCTVSQMPKCP